MVKVSFDFPTSRENIPIHQFGTLNSSPPRGPPWWLNRPKTTPSCMNVHGDVPASGGI